MTEAPPSEKGRRQRLAQPLVLQDAKVLRGTAWTAAIRAGSIAIAFLASLIYARVLGPRGYGLYALVMAWVGVVTIPAGLGLPQYIMRECASGNSSMRGSLRWADRRIAMAGGLAAVLLAVAGFITEGASHGVLFLLAAPLPLLLNLSSMRQSLLQSRGWIAASQWPQQLMAPAITLGILLVVWRAHRGLQTLDLMTATLIAALGGLLVNSGQLAKILVRENGEPAMRHRISAALPFMWLGGLYLIVSRVDMLMLGGIKGAYEAGIYGVALRAAELIPLFLTATNTAIAPAIARLHNAGERDQLQQLVTAAARRLLITTAPPALLLIVAAKPLLTLFYGKSFADAAIALQILAIGQLGMVISGPVGILLNMTEHAALSARAFAAGLGLNVVLTALLVPSFGFVGAAVSATSTSLMTNFLRWHWVRARLQIRPSSFGI